MSGQLTVGLRCRSTCLSFPSLSSKIFCFYDFLEAEWTVFLSGSPFLSCVCLQCEKLPKTCFWRILFWLNIENLVEFSSQSSVVDIIASVVVSNEANRWIFWVVTVRTHSRFLFWKEKKILEFQIGSGRNFVAKPRLCSTDEADSHSLSLTWVLVDYRPR